MNPAGMFNKTATIYRAAASESSMGATSFTYSSTSETMACSIQPRDSQSGQQYEPTPSRGR